MGLIMSVSRLAQALGWGQKSSLSEALGVPQVNGLPVGWQPGAPTAPLSQGTALHTVTVTQLGCEQAFSSS